MKIKNKKILFTVFLSVVMLSSIFTEKSYAQGINLIGPQDQSQEELEERVNSGETITIQGDNQPMHVENGTVVSGRGNEEEDKTACPENPNFWSAPICWLGDKIQKIVFGAIYLLLAAAVLLVSLIGNLATMLFVHMIDGSIVTGVLNNHIVYDLWTSVRDLLNMVFIIALLYSAFSTIFGIESFHAKSVVKKVIIAAFLVNFSFPIARFIVDFFNYLMYYLVGVLGFDDPGANSLFGDSGPINQVRTLALSVNQEYITGENLAMAMMAIVFIFIFSTTLLIIAFLFIIRTIVLALLIIFSPIAFVGPLLPFTATYAKQWWGKLFQYCMFGPIMMFMLYMATQFAIALSELNMSAAEAGGGVQGGLIATIALFSMPLVVLWAGMGIAQSSSIAFAGAVQSKATGAMKWATGYTAATGFGKATYEAYKTRGTSGDKNDVSNKLGSWAARKADSGYSKAPGVIGRKGAIRLEDNVSSSMENEAKMFKMKDLDNNRIEALMRNKSKIVAGAALSESIDRKMFDSKNQAHVESYEKYKKDFGTEGKHFHGLNDKLKPIDSKLAFNHIADTEKRKAAKKEYSKSDKFKAAEIKGGTIDDDEFMTTAFENGAISNDAVKEMIKSGHKDKLKGSFNRLAQNKDFNKAFTKTALKDESNQKLEKALGNFHQAYFNTMGKAMAGAKTQYVKKIADSLNKDNAGSINTALAKRMGSGKLLGSFIENKSAKKVKEILQNMSPDSGQILYEGVTKSAGKNLNKKLQAKLTIIQNGLKNDSGLKDMFK